ncbi:hypothetical protein BU14_0352s0019 [Porphyra umbilicalis]|uniref:Uncharacterized protein n=1 Tax=Porphyra umbilicalis TaxID=2786 RepID=A0A1X6NXY3_PORUM|nr:hypothetical protein BU14_0352s0019 [Porphyra umbilicalis]|eukprot:OSX73400.1 hypothetical protein BU14_0352s0019 [Porphyra umbilicalis]
MEPPRAAVAWGWPRRRGAGGGMVTVVEAPIRTVTCTRAQGARRAGVQDAALAHAGRSGVEGHHSGDFVGGAARVGTDGGDGHDESTGNGNGGIPGGAAGGGGGGGGCGDGVDGGAGPPGDVPPPTSASAAVKAADDASRTLFVIKKSVGARSTQSIPPRRDAAPAGQPHHPPRGGARVARGGQRRRTDATDAAAGGNGGCRNRRRSAKGGRRGGGTAVWACSNHLCVAFHALPAHQKTYRHLPGVNSMAPRHGLDSLL